MKREKRTLNWEDLSKEISKKHENDGLDISYYEVSFSRRLCQCSFYEWYTWQWHSTNNYQMQKWKKPFYYYYLFITYYLLLMRPKPFAENIPCIAYFVTLKAVVTFFFVPTSPWEVLVKPSGSSVKDFFNNMMECSLCCSKSNRASEKNWTHGSNWKIVRFARGDAKTFCLFCSSFNFTFLCYLRIWKDWSLNEFKGNKLYAGVVTSLNKLLMKIKGIKVFIIMKSVSTSKKSNQNALISSENNDIQLEWRNSKKMGWKTHFWRWESEKIHSNDSTDFIWRYRHTQKPFKM